MPAARGPTHLSDLSLEVLLALSPCLHCMSLCVLFAFLRPQPHHIRHGQSRSSINFNGALMRASWEHSRFFALVPASGGRFPGIFITKSTNCTGSNPVLHVNAATLGAPAHINAEILVGDASNGISALRPLRGYSVEDCTPFVGDLPDGNISWSGDPLRPLPSSFHIRFYLTRSRLWGFSLTCI